MYSECNRSVSVAMAGKAAEHSRLPRLFGYFLGRCQKVNKENSPPYSERRFTQDAKIT